MEYTHLSASDSRDLQRVCERFDVVFRECPEFASVFIGETGRGRDRVQLLVLSRWTDRWA
jgi:hypothetical protein